MKTILITGPDGAGKNTLLSMLRKNAGGDIGFFTAPYLNEEQFESNDRLSQVLGFIHWLYTEADNLETPQLRTMSLFACMLIYKDVLDAYASKGASYVFCDRHPLVDTAVYGGLYAPVINPDSIPKPVLAEIDYNFNSELFYLTSKLGLKKADMPRGAFYHLQERMYQRFGNEEECRFEKLTRLYQCNFPEKIFYLQVSPGTLEERLRRQARKREVRENGIRILEEYEALLRRLPVAVEKTDAEDPEQLGFLTENIRRGYFAGV